MKSEYKKYRDVMLDTTGRFRTAGLFWEYRKSAGLEEKYPPLFTIRDKDRTIDGKFYRSLKAIYFTYDHIPGYEYEFAMDVFGSWDHWVWMTTKTQVRGELTKWREEYSIMLKNIAHKTLIAQSKDTEKGLAAAKMIVSDEHEGKKRGRPSNAEKAMKLKSEAGIRETLDEDMQRLGIKVVK